MCCAVALQRLQLKRRGEYTEMLDLEELITQVRTLPLARYLLDERNEVAFGAVVALPLSLSLCLCWLSLSVSVCLCLSVSLSQTLSTLTLKIP